jgi:hypothetical protein
VGFYLRRRHAAFAAFSATRFSFHLKATGVATIAAPRGSWSKMYPATFSWCARSLIGIAFDLFAQMPPGSTPEPELAQQVRVALCDPDVLPRVAVHRADECVQVMVVKRRDDHLDVDLPQA